MPDITPEVFEYFRTKAREGDVSAQASLGMSYWQRGELDEAETWLGMANKIDLKKHQLCSKHYQAFWRYGDPLGSPTASVIETQRCRVWFGLAPAAAQPDVLGA